MSTLYIDEPGASIHRRGETLVVSKDEVEIAEVELCDLEQVVICAHSSLTSAALQALISRGIDTCLLDWHGEFVARLAGPPGKNILLRQAQFAMAAEPARCLAVAREFERGKITNQRTLLQRAQRYRGVNDVAMAVQALQSALDSLDGLSDLEALRGVEGAAAHAYFQAFRFLLRDDYGFTGRQRRPPPDPVNSLLSFAYALLQNAVDAALNLVGFDPYCGFFHSIVYGRPALTLDLMEEFRPAIADVLVFLLLNNRRLTAADFEATDQGPRLSEKGREVFFAAFKERLETVVTHPVTGESQPYRRQIERQARLLAEVVLGQREKYPAWVRK
jgi:CRISPR-associated protein Cas1